MKGAQEVLDQLAKLRARQIGRGCTVAEQEAAARRIGELLMQYEELEVALPDRKGARLHPLSPEQRSQRQRDEDLQDENPVDLGFVFTLQVTEKAVLIALPYRTQHRFHPPTPELWVPLAHILSASRAAIRRDGRTAWPLLVTRGWAKKMGLS